MYENLTKYLEYIVEDKYGKWGISEEDEGNFEHSKQVPYANYSEFINEFVKSVYSFIEQHKEMNLGDYTNILQANGIDLQKDVDVKNLDVQCILALIVSKVRSEKFCDGAVLSSFEDGYMEKCLLRLKELDKTERRNPKNSIDIIRQIFDEINDNYYEKLKEISSGILRFRVIDVKEVSRDFYLEKIYDYLDAVNVKNGINPRRYEYVSIYVGSLLGLIDNKFVKGSRAEKYYKKAKSIEYKIKDNKENCAELLKDFTRIFVSLYLECIKSNKPLEDFDFSLSYEALQKTVDGMKSEKITALFSGKEKMVINIRNRYSKMTYTLFFLEMIYLNMLSMQKGE